MAPQEGYFEVKMAENPAIISMRHQQNELGNDWAAKSRDSERRTHGWLTGRRMIQSMLPADKLNLRPNARFNKRLQAVVVVKG